VTNARTNERTKGNERSDCACCPNNR